MMIFKVITYVSVIFVFIVEFSFSINEVVYRKKTFKKWFIIDFIIFIVLFLIVWFLENRFFQGIKI